MQDELIAIALKNKYIRRAGLSVFANKAWIGIKNGQPLFGFRAALSPEQFFCLGGRTL